MDKNDFILDKKASLEKLLGGTYFHLKSDELKTDQQDYSYISLPDELVKNKNKKPWIRYCDDKCKFPKNWAERIYLKLINLDPTKCYNINQLQNNVAILERCKKCGKDEHCEINECQDTIRLIIAMSKHSQTMRSIKRLVHKIRAVNIWLIQFENSIQKANKIQMERMMFAHLKT